MKSILKSICALPTAPFQEQAVAHWVRKLAGRHGLTLQEDSYGNLLIGPRTRRKRWVVVAHMDHPGLVVRQSAGGRTEALVRGYVEADYLRRAPILFLPPGGEEIRGRVSGVTTGERNRAVAVEVKTPTAVATGTLGMFDLEIATVRGKLLYSRALDDLAGVAGALEALIQLARRGDNAHLAVLLTRGEEEGFIGAIAAAQESRLIRKSDRIVSIECSAEQPAALQGAGVVIRVGDRMSVFDPELTLHIEQVAHSLARRSRRFCYQRALMPGGTCEATAFAAFGYRTAAVCIPLGNYHNMDRRRRKLSAEYIHLDDWENLVRLLVGLGSSHDNQAMRQLQKSLKERFDLHRKLLGAVPAE